MARLVFDIGGTNLRMAVAADGALGPVRKVPSPARPEDAIDALRAFAADAGTPIDDAVGGIAGIVHVGIATDLPHLPGWNGFDFAAALTTAINTPATLRNDADLAGLGEAVLGAGKGVARVGYLSIGTGVGGTLVVDGVLPDSGNGIEPGKAIMDLHGRTLEDFLGGAALASEFGAPAQDLPASVYEERSRVLALGIANAAWLWSADLVVLNGSLMNDANGFRIDTVRVLLGSLPEGKWMPRLAPAAFGDSSGLYGALALSPAGPA